MNQTYIEAMLDRMERSKMNLNLLHNEAFWVVDQPHKPAFEKLNGGPFKQSLMNVSRMHADRRIGLVPHLPPGGYFGGEAFPNAIEGVYLRNQSYKVEGDALLPVAPALPRCNTCSKLHDASTCGACPNNSLTLPFNGDFALAKDEDTPAGWSYEFATDSGNKSTCTTETVPGMGRVVRCDGAPSEKWWSVASDEFQVEADAYHVNALVRTENCSGDGADITMESMEYNGCASGAQLPQPSSDWVNLSFTWECTEVMAKYKIGGPEPHFGKDRGLSQVASGVRLRSTMLSHSGCTWYVAKVSVLRLGSALINVMRTNDTDVQVVDASSGQQFELGRDYQVDNPPMPNQAAVNGNPGGDSPNLMTNYQLGSEYRYRLRRLSSGRISDTTRLNVSFDVLPGILGEGGDGHFPVSLAESMVEEYWCDAARAVMTLTRSPAVMASEDEVWGINRDSRAQRLGLSNAELFAHHTNKLQACVVSIGAELGYEKDAFLFVWDDM